MPEYDLTDGEAFELLRERIETQLDRLEKQNTRLDEAYIKSYMKSSPPLKAKASDGIGASREKVQKLEEAVAQLAELIHSRADEAEQLLEELANAEGMD